MSSLNGHVLLGVSVLVGSAIPFVPTGEMVSGAAAYASQSKFNLLLIFLITWVASTLGDTLALLEARLFSRRLRGWLAKRKFADRVTAAQDALTRNAFNAIVTGRLIPGGRSPTIMALGLSRYSVRRFVAYDLIACALWAAIYSSLGSIGGRIANHPIWAMAIAIAFAVSIGALVQQIHKLCRWWLQRAARRNAEPDAEDPDPEDSAPVPHGSGAHQA